MITIPEGPICLRSRAVVLSQAELEVILHALIEERDRVVRAGGNQYGLMTIEKLSSFIAELQNYKNERGV